MSWLIKPLTLLLAPFLLPQLGVAGLGSLALWGGYLRWAQQWEFGRRQVRFLLHQVCIRRMPLPGQMRLRPVVRVSRLSGIWGTFLWRWRALGRQAFAAWPVYLFPAYLRRWTWQGMVLAGLIIMGYGNCKYLLLDLLFVFPALPARDTERFS